MVTYQKEQHNEVAEVLAHAVAHDPNFGQGKFTAIGQAIIDFADLFSENSPDFDRAKFLADCGV